MTVDGRPNIMHSKFRNNWHISIREEDYLMFDHQKQAYHVKSTFVIKNKKNIENFWREELMHHAKHKL